MSHSDNVRGHGVPESLRDHWSTGRSIGLSRVRQLGAGVCFPVIASVLRHHVGLNQSSFFSPLADTAIQQQTGDQINTLALSESPPVCELNTQIPWGDGGLVRDWIRAARPNADSIPRLGQDNAVREDLGLLRLRSLQLVGTATVDCFVLSDPYACDFARGRKTRVAFGGVVV